MRPCIRIYYFKVFYCPTRFEQHIAYQQELKNCICSLWVSICLWLPADIGGKTQTYVKPEAANTVFELLLLSDVSLETC